MSPQAARAQDGSWVEVYRRLPSRGEPEVVHAAVPPGCEILELGCGAGRITHRLLALGHRVVAVDQSPEMLANVRGAEVVLGDIESLALGRPFRAVLLASNLINTAVAGQRAGFLATCRRHLAPGGSVILERMHPHWLDAELAGHIDHVTQWGPVRFSVVAARLEGTILEATMIFQVGGIRMVDTFLSEILDDDALLAALAGAGLALDRWLDAEHRWVLARAGPS